MRGSNIIGRRNFLIEVLREAATFITDSDLTVADRVPLVTDGALLEVVPEFPRGFGSDQVIFRYLHPRFHPGRKLDYDCLPALR